MKITFNEAKEFLDNITSKDKVAIIHHDDGDGFAAGILFYDWCKAKGARIEAFTYMIGKSKFKEYNLEDFNKILIADLAPDLISEDLELIKKKQVLYTDHHPQAVQIPEEILELRTISEGYIPSSETVGQLTGLKSWLSLAGTITDSGELYSENAEFINKTLKEYNLTLEEFKENISSVITNFLIYFDKNLDEAFDVLRKLDNIKDIEILRKYSEPVEKETKKLVDRYEDEVERLGDVNFYYFEPDLSVKPAVTGIIGHRDRDSIYIFASLKKGTDKVTLSARNTSQRRNMPDLLEAGIKSLKDARSGGHPPAAGGILYKKDLEQFKQNVREYIESNPSK